MKEHGKTVYFYRNPNTVEMEVEMRNGKRNGEFRRYFVNGLLDTYCVYADDSIEGVEVMYTANGCKSQEYTYVHGRKTGPHKAYHLNVSVTMQLPSIVADTTYSFVTCGVIVMVEVVWPVFQWKLLEVGCEAVRT